MKKKLFCVLFVCVFAVSAYAQKAEDDNKPCTRAQLAQLIVDTFPQLIELANLNRSAPSPYDVEKTHPNYLAIEVNLKLGINEEVIDGYRPGLRETRYTVVMSMLRLLNAIESYYKIKFPIEIRPLAFSKVFADVASSYILHDKVMELYGKGFINGYANGKFKGRQPATVKEVKLVLQRIKEKTEALLKEKETTK